MLRTDSLSQSTSKLVRDERSQMLRLIDMQIIVARHTAPTLLSDDKACLTIVRHFGTRLRVIYLRQRNRHALRRL